MDGFPFLSVVLGVSAIATAGLAVVGFRRRSTPGARAFALLASSMALYSGLYAISLPIPLGQTRAALGAAQWFGIALLPVTWLLFALEYSGRPKYLRRRVVVALCVVPALAVGGAVAQAMPVPDASLASQFGDLFYTSTTGTSWRGHTFLEHGLGPLHLLYIVFAYGCFLTGIAVLFEYVVRFDGLYRGQAASVVVGALFPWAGNVVAVLNAEPIEGLDLLPFFVPVTAVLFGNAVFRHDLLDLVPATRRKGESKVVAEMRDAVVVVDDSERIVTVNEAACEQFGVERDDALGERLREVVGITVDDAADRFQVDSDGRVYEVTVSPVHDRTGVRLGLTLVFRDITAHRDAQQRLSVLNRVLRHNLRTEVNVISGYASMVERELPAHDAEMAGKIATAADTLDELGQKAREVERIMSRDPDAGQTIVLDDVVVEAVDRVRTERDGVSIAVECPDDVHVTVDAVVFEAVLGELVGALVHYGGDDPEISVSASVDDGSVTVRIDDRADGIPATEYEVVRDGEETPLEHASGLSLWLVKWGVRRLDGEVTFDDEGEVVLSVPDCIVAPGHARSATDGTPADPARDESPSGDETADEAPSEGAFAVGGPSE